MENKIQNSNGVVFLVNVTINEPETKKESSNTLKQLKWSKVMKVLLRIGLGIIFLFLEK